MCVECVEGAKDKVKRPEGSLARCQRAPRLLFSYIFLTGVKAFIASSPLSNGQSTQQISDWFELSFTCLLIFSLQE